MPGSEIITIFKNFPRKHIFTLLLGISLLISISILGSSDFDEDIEVNDLETLLNGLKLVGDYLDKTILRPNNLNYPNSRLLFLNTLK